MITNKISYRCGERSRQREQGEDGLEYSDGGSHGSYHTPKLGEENIIPVPVVEPTPLPAVQSVPLSDQENIPPRMVTPPPSNVLVEIPNEEESLVKECCRTTLAVRNQRAIRGKGRITKPYQRPARKQLASHCGVFEVFQDSFDRRQRLRRLQRGLGGYESSSESGEDGLVESDGSAEVPFLG